MVDHFREWIACPRCDEREAVSVLAHKTEFVFECYDCGLVSEFTVGDDVPLQGLDPTVPDATGDRASE